jgi:hypothetical protein
MTNAVISCQQRQHTNCSLNLIFAHFPRFFRYSLKWSEGKGDEESEGKKGNTGTTTEPHSQHITFWPWAAVLQGLSSVASHTTKIFQSCPYLLNFPRTLYYRHGLKLRFLIPHTGMELLALLMKLYISLSKIPTVTCYLHSGLAIILPIPT